MAQPVPSNFRVMERQAAIDDAVEGESELLSCPMCHFVSENLPQLQTHIENEHFAASMPDAPQAQSQSEDSFPCPMCGEVFVDAPQLESHFGSEHADQLTPAKKRKTPSPDEDSTGGDVVCMDESPSDQLSCPVCPCKGFANEAVLSRHVEEHFSSEGMQDHVESDEQFALRLAADSRREEVEFKRLQELYGFDGRTMDQEADKALAKAVQRGEISVVDYHEKRILLKASEKDGVDDASSVTRDVIPRLRTLCTDTKNVQRVWLCSPMDHYAGSVGDSGWGCGFRNFQMMLSSLLRNPQYVERLKKFCPEQTQGGLVQVPSITRLQGAIEEAWKEGFDPQGRDQLGGRVVGTTKWIGATEISCVLASSRIRYRLVDFTRPTSADGKLHPALFDWVLKYFRGPSDFKPPLYFQHQGHSRTIVGIEEFQQSKTRLLILDPSHKQMGQLMSPDPSAVLKRIRVGLPGLKARQYQIVCVEGGFVDNEREYLESRTLRSSRVP